MKLSDMVGETVVALIPIFDSKLQLFKLHGVEAGGIWVESQKLTNDFLQKVGYPASPKTLVVFVPYNQVAFALGSADVPAFSEKAFGV